jgi:hypothetical protein
MEYIAQRTTPARGVSDLDSCTSTRLSGRCSLILVIVEATADDIVPITGECAKLIDILLSTQYK